MLVIDPAKLTAELRDEDPGIGTAFPHVYGPIDEGAVVEVRPLQRGSDGAWKFADAERP